MTTWAYSVNMHPWFRQPTLKRQLSDDPDDDEHDTDRISARVAADSPSVPLAESSPRKRRRCDTLERGIAELTLNNPANYMPAAPARLVHHSTSSSATTAPTTVYTHAPAPGLTITHIQPSAPPSQPAWDASQTPYAYLYPYNYPLEPVVLPESVEEPTSPSAYSTTLPELPDVEMRGPPSWYEIEKDRIVINDLDDSDVDEPDEGIGGMTVSPALLERLASQNKNTLPIFPEEDTSKALVLFRPLVVPDASAEEKKPEEEAEEIPCVSPAARTALYPDDDDAMDVDPMDIDIDP